MAEPITSAIAPSPAELREVVRLKHDHDDISRYGWATRMRLRFEYFTPDELYEATVARLVTPGCAWIDVGCGRRVFPNNPVLAKALAERCALLVGVDPDATIEENPLVHEKARCLIDDYQADRAFDLITLRMVAEHIADPDKAVASLARLTAPGGRVVIYTVNRWSPVPIASRVIPFGLHYPIKRRLWGGGNEDEKDTFPVVYKMNTRRHLRRHLEAHGFREESFTHLDDCRTLSRFRAGLWLELSTRRALRALGLTYPENCLLGVYQKVQPDAAPSPAS
jgi:SAM-dependent methyltransferase